MPERAGAAASAARAQAAGASASTDSPSAASTATDAIADLLSLLKKFKAMVEKLTRDDYVDFVERATETDATANINKFKADLKKNWTVGHQLEHSPLADVLTTVRTLMMEAQRICKQNIMPPATAGTMRAGGLMPVMPAPKRCLARPSFVAPAAQSISSRLSSGNVFWYIVNATRATPSTNSR